MLPVVEGKQPRAVSPLEVARTFLARGQDAPLRVSDPDAKTVSPNEVSTRAATISGVRPSQRGVELPPRADAVAPLVDERYVRLGVLGQGGMGRVEEVFDRVLGRPVARKALLRDADELRSTMLVGEAQTCAQLEHPSIVPVYDLDAGDDGQPYYTMRVVRGRSLRDVLDERTTPFAQVLGIFRQVCLAVDYAHSRGVVHRDLKPENVVVGEFGEVYVVDWGIAHLVEGSSVRRAETVDVVAGTPGYMAPEQSFGAGIDARTDVFALGVMLYEVVAGARPFADGNLDSVRARRGLAVDCPPSRKSADRNAPRAFDDLVLACLSPTPKGRPGRARVLANAIDDYLDGERVRLEREKEADQYAERGNEAWRRTLALEAQASELESQAERTLASLPSWTSAEEKQAIWDAEARARQLRSEAAEARAEAVNAFSSGLGRVSDHRPARKGLAALYFQQFEQAERSADYQQMAHLLGLARAYDDGALALDLANESELSIETWPGHSEVEVLRYETKGPLLVLSEPKQLGPTPTSVIRLPSGSYLVRMRTEAGELRYPVLLARAKRYRLKLRVPRPGDVPSDMVFVPGGPFSSWIGPNRNGVEVTLPDFAIARFPVTLREYARFLEASPEHEQSRLLPENQGTSDLVRDESGVWRLGPRVVMGEARQRIPTGRELELPVGNIAWAKAMAYADWLAETSGRPYRLPTALEWEKAARGADGRPYPMGHRLDPAFAKTRDSRPEAAQPEPIGAFPLDESPYGVRDLAGGVGDWTLSAPDGQLVARGETDTPTSAYKRQVYWCGGSWSHSRVSPEMRYTQSVESWGGWIGFRLVLPLDSEGSSELVSEPMRGA